MAMSQITIITLGTYCAIRFGTQPHATKQLQSFLSLNTVVWHTMSTKLYKKLSVPQESSLFNHITLTLMTQQEMVYTGPGDLANILSSINVFIHNTTEYLFPFPGSKNPN